jgi:methylenetetrahydrofolate reductase (NADPH)
MLLPGEWLFMDKRGVQDLLTNYSIETTVKEGARIERFADVVPAGTRMFIAHVPGTDPAETVVLAKRLRDEGMEPVPHIVGPRIENLTAVDYILGRLAGQAGVKEVLVVAGDVAQPVGQLTSGLEILESGLLEKHGIKTLGVAGHPEGHKDVSDEKLNDALRRKNDYAKKTGANVRIVTQFTFSADPFIDWENTHRADIGSLPVTAGLPGLASAKTLLKFAMDCGVGASLQAFTKRAGSLTKLLVINAPDDIVVGLAKHKQQNPQTHITGVHFFPFGGLKRTAEWANKVVNGQFEFTSNGQGLEVA